MQTNIYLKKVATYLWFTYFAITEKTKQGGLWIYVFENPLYFLGLFSPLEIPDKARLYPEKLHRTVLQLSEILRPKTKTLWNPTWFFLDHHWKFHVVLINSLKNPLAISSILLGIPYPQPPCSVGSPYWGKQVGVPFTRQKFAPSPRTWKNSPTKFWLPSYQNSIALPPFLTHRSC